MSSWTHRLEVDSVVGEKVVAVDGRLGRAAAFTRLADDHLDAAYRLAHAILGNRAEAEDATHDALVQAWRRWGQLHDHTRFEHWFDRILVNTCRSRLRQTNRRLTRDLSPELAASERDPTGQIDDRDQMRAALAQLSPDHRVVVALRFYRDLPISEIARRIGVPEGTVNSRLHYALRHLRETLGDLEYPGADR
jgi:RNA polymerase sigma-70 factor (ECF subfamily)